MNKIFTFLLCFVCAFTYSSTNTIKLQQKIVYDSSQVTIVKIPPGEIEKLMEDPDYSYVEKEAPPKTGWDRFRKWVERLIAELFNPKAVEYSLEIVKIIICIAIVFLVIWLILKNDIRSVFYGNSSSVPILNRTDENIHEIDFDKRIAEELASGDFRKAIRFLFLKLINELNNRSLITFQLDKTNADYYKELRKTNYAKEFKELSQMYEYVWYGDFKLDEPNYRMIIQKFNQFKITGNR